ncbi:hypothetical protein [Nocardioides abyssi]|uniref:Uncharacterized protein n=1 Tax=Nocardioides abyssi TaxID=3058370 RepID=A0ABT8ESE7_9ACTN|nr:hypothetical protein [Nocardioides abyssi]MDN4161044.1 hypothetical protein [Nocardioides abyssi]
MSDPLAWLPEADHRLLESYRRIGCSETEARLAVGGDLLQRWCSSGGTEVTQADLDRYLEASGLTVEAVVDALGLRFDASA